VEKALKNSKKAAIKAPNPILHEIIRGFTYTHNQKAVFSVIENPFFRIFLVRCAAFCPLGGFLRLFLQREITIKARAFFLGAYSAPLNEIPAQIRDIFNEFLTILADQSSSQQDCAIRALIG